jgi:hypothetical protein
MREDVREHTVSAAMGDWAFWGELLAEEDTRIARRPRWTEMALYRQWDVREDDSEPDAPRGYVLHIIGCSVLYHVHRGGCRRGQDIAGSEIGTEGEPCPDCRPPRPPDANTVYDMEEDLFTVYACPAADDVLERLRDRRVPETEVGHLSVPARRLMQKAAEKDDGIAQAISAVRRLETRLRTRA